MFIQWTYRMVPAALMCFGAAVASAAQVHNLRQDADAQARVQSLTVDVADPSFRAALGLSAGESLEVLRSYDQGADGKVTRYRQTFRGVPVWGEQVIVGRDGAGGIKSLNGRLVIGLAAEMRQLQPGFDEKEALSRMQAKVQATFSTPADFANERSELVIYVDDGTPILSYAVSFFADSENGGTPTRPTYIIDAITGDILLEYEGLTHADQILLNETNVSGSRRRWQYFTVPEISGATDNDILEISISGGSGDADLYTRQGFDPTSSVFDCRPYLPGNNETCTAPAKNGDLWHIGLYPYRNFSGVNLVARIKTLAPIDGSGPGGNEKTGQYFYGTDFGSLSVVDSGGGTCTMNNANVKTVNLNHGTSGSTAYSFGCFYNDYQAINGAYSPLNDAHYFGGVVFDMYQEYLGTAPLTFQLTMRVHYSSNYENAFWDGSAMTFGDGASTFYPLVSLDVSAHEVSHGFTEQNSNLTYSGESGGINEAFSDMAGEAAEYYMHGSNDFLVGAEIFKGTGALRNMCNPTGSSIGNIADYYNGLDVHYSSGIYNKAFCALAKTGGWDTEMAFKAFAQANQHCWVDSTGFEDGAQCVVDAADDLGLVAEDVVAAFETVGITGLTVSGGGTPPPPSGSGIELTLVDSFKIKGVMHVQLSWSTSIASPVIKRNDAVIPSCEGDSNSCEDILGKGSGVFVYEVCADQAETDCSNRVTATF